MAATSARALQGEPIDHELFLAQTEMAVHRAKAAGGNCVEHVYMLPRLISIEDAVTQLGTTLEGIESLVSEGKLDPVKAGRHVRLERAAVDALAKDRLAE